MYNLALDMDNTINKLSPHFIQYLEYELWGNENKPKYTYPDVNLNNIIAEEVETLDYFYYKYYELDKYFPKIPKDLFREQLYSYVFNDYEFWITIPPMENIYEAIQILNESYKLYIVTHAYNNYQASREGKLNWIKKNLPFIRRNQIIFDDKSGDLSNYDIIIDDNPWMLENAKKQGLFTVKIKHGYNKNVETDQEIDFRYRSGWDRSTAMWLSNFCS